MIGFFDLRAGSWAAARRALPRAWRTSGASNGDGEVAHAVERLPRGDAAVERRRRRAGERAPQPERDQRLGGASGRRPRRRRREVGGVVEDEAQRHRLGLGPGEGQAERRLLPGGEVDEVALVGAQRVGRRAADVEVGERGLVGRRQGRGPAAAAAAAGRAGRDRGATRLTAGALRPRSADRRQIAAEIKSRDKRALSEVMGPGRHPPG